MMPEPSQGLSFDLIVIGSGAAGLSAAATAASSGLSVLVLEKDDVIGGTTAWSGGWIWAPGNPLAHRIRKGEGAAAPRAYLKTLLGNRFEAERIDAFLNAAPKMVSFFETNTALTFECGAAIPDTYGDLPGAGTGARSVIAAAYDARGLGRDVTRLRKPVRETTFFGMTIQSGPDLRAFMTMMRSPSAFVHATKRVLRHMRDLARHRRGMDLRNGAALVARLFRSALDLSVEFQCGVQVDEMLRDGARVSGVALSDGRQVLATRAVVLACGGYPHDPARRAKTFPRDSEHRTLAVPAATGGGLALAEAAGGHIRTNLRRPAAFCPVSTVRWPDGRVADFPHIIDRGEPGIIGVLPNGKRFCNAGLGYHDYVEALLDATPDDEPARSWLICDHRALRRYGLGVVRPSPVPWRQWRRRGYLKTGQSIADMAAVAGIDADGLTRTIMDFNKDAERGSDPAFGRGRTPYMRLQGDPDQRPNPCVAPIIKAPFHTVEVVPGSFGTFAGVSTDAHARVLDEQGRAIDGLYAAGADASSIFGGFYPAGGISIGPAMTFGYIAGRHAAKAET